ncbi:pancreatic lipase-related protein 2-like [Leguminivora glycinivorella]|uniref:pancreatic lipase-related protein 2-like n=1 Tax=Leguminivora glycinivorella TaxID=1035111 RepID=UPI002010051D|nr:pancreatic lipase-related protein 2-like [Leguminivora glycinivorella]
MKPIVLLLVIAHFTSGILFTIKPQNVENHLDVARSSENLYFLFTRLNPTTGQQLTMDKDSILASNFNPSQPTVVVCHGYTQSLNSQINQLIRDAYLQIGDFNVIILDWSHSAQGIYTSAIASVPSVGQALGSMLLFIHAVTGTPLETIHVVGFSLGAHVAGTAGRTTGSRVGRVTGLDPVSPIWLINRNRIASTDGIYVECIHTYGNNGGVAWGDVDFYVNGGGSQPGCVLSTCSHNRSYQIFAATVKYDHLVGKQCGSQDDVVVGVCSGPELPLGNGAVQKSGSGLYYVSTGRSYPY